MMGILCIIAWNVTGNINRLKLSSSLGRIRVDKEKKFAEEGERMSARCRGILMGAGES